MLRVALPISAFWATYQITKLNDGTKNITFVLTVFQVEKFDITIADRIRKVFQGYVLREITLESMSSFSFAQGRVARQRDILCQQDARTSPCDRRPKLYCSGLGDHTAMSKEP